MSVVPKKRASLCGRLESTLTGDRFDVDQWRGLAHKLEDRIVEQGNEILVMTRALRKSRKLNSLLFPFLESVIEEISIGSDDEDIELLERLGRAIESAKLRPVDCPNCRLSHTSHDGNQYCDRCAAYFEKLGGSGFIDRHGVIKPPKSSRL